MFWSSGFEYYDYFEHGIMMFTHFKCLMLYFDGFNRRVVAAFVNAQFNMKLGRTQIGKGVKNIFPGSFIQCNLKIETSDDLIL